MFDIKKEDLKKFKFFHIFLMFLKIKKNTQKNMFLKILILENFLNFVLNFWQNFLENSQI